MLLCREKEWKGCLSICYIESIRGGLSIFYEAVSVIFAISSFLKKGVEITTLTFIPFIFCFTVLPNERNFYVYLGLNFYYLSKQQQQISKHFRFSQTSYWHQPGEIREAGIIPQPLRKIVPWGSGWGTVTHCSFNMHYWVPLYIRLCACCQGQLKKEIRISRQCSRLFGCFRTTGLPHSKGSR